MIIILKGQPKSTQHCYKTTCMGGRPRLYMSNECKDLKEDYQWQAKSQWHKKPLDRELDVSIDLYFGTKRKSDIDNFCKLILDSLEGIVYENDNQIMSLNITKHYDKNAPRAEVTIF